MFKSGTQAIAVLGGAVALAIVLTPKAHAEGLFEMLFGGGRRSSPPPAVQAFTAPLENLVDRLGGERGNIRSEGGTGYASYCVRTCDGAHFPLQRTSANPAELCNSFCPSANTKVFSGSKIETSVASDGTRYADLDNAFAYREKLSATCTCNGKTPGGLATLDAQKDPTLRPGDIVATPAGLVAYNGSSGGRDKTANFTPVSDYGRFSKDARAKLSELRVTKIEPQAAPVAASNGTRANELRQQAVFDPMTGVNLTR